MNTNNNATTVVCFGDSNTFGQKPDDFGRFIASQRWPGVLQTELGGEYYVIEEGLGGRTTDIDNFEEHKPNKNGLSYFKSCIESHRPVNSILIMLGTNDLKDEYVRSVEAIADSLSQYHSAIKSMSSRRNLPMPEVVFISPSPLNADAPDYIRPNTARQFTEESAIKSKKLAGSIQQMAENIGCYFLDSAQCTNVGKDGVHIDISSHAALGKALASLVSKL